MTAAIVVIALVIAGPAPRAAGQSTSSIPSTLFGMTLINQKDWPQVPVGALGKAPMVSWPYSEPQRGVYDWTNLDAAVQLATDHRVDLFFSNGLVPPWAAADQSTCAPTFSGSPVIGCTSSVANIQDWDNFVTALVTRYKGKLIYELWNEPNSKSYTGTLADMVLLTAHEHNIIRSIYPAALIATPAATYGTAGPADWLAQYFAAGGPTGVDIVSWHAYWPTPEPVVNEINKMRALMAQHGLSSKPLWDTEGAWTHTLTASQQAGFLARFYLLQGALGASRFYWYAWDSPATGTMWDPTNGMHPDAVAYQQVYNWMVGATPSGPCTMASNSTWTCFLTRPGGYEAVAVWNSAVTTSYAPASTFKYYRDLSGNTVRIQGSVVIGYNPILFENQTAAAPPTNLVVTSIK